MLVAGGLKVFLEFNDKSKLQVLQLKFVRFMLGLHPRSHIHSNEFVKINWSPVELRVNKIMLCHLHRILNGKAPSYLNQNLVRVSQHHQYHTSSVSSLVVDRAHSAGNSSFIHVAKVLWNSLPRQLTNICSNNSFKHNL